MNGVEPGNFLTHAKDRGLNILEPFRRLLIIVIVTVADLLSYEQNMLNR